MAQAPGVIFPAVRELAALDRLVLLAGVTLARNLDERRVDNVALAGDEAALSQQPGEHFEQPVEESGQGEFFAELPDRVLVGNPVGLGYIQEAVEAAPARIWNCVCSSDRP